MDDISTVVRLVDDWQDDNPLTRDSCPGKVNGHNLIHIANQIERRIFRKGKLKHLIFLEDGTQNIWYKNSMCNAGVVAMGFSLLKLRRHPKAIPMELYYKIFSQANIKRNHLIIEIGATPTEWMKRNDFELI